MIDSGTLARLVEQGRAKGQLTNQDLQAALPVDAMSAEDLALVVVHLEDAGISVDLDESLLAAAPSGAPRPNRPAEIVLHGSEADHPPPRTFDQTLSASEVPPLSNAPGPEPSGGPSAHKAVLLAGIILLVLAFVVLWLIR